jgi:hypothetical protein
MGDDMRDWRTKLTSRKFWCAICGVVISVMVMLGSSEEEQSKTTALITATGTLIAYIIGEGLTDSANKEGDISDECGKGEGLTTEDERNA